MVKLLSLADLGGMADLVSGKGLSFDTLEIKFSKNKQTIQYLATHYDFLTKMLQMYCKWEAGRQYTFFLI